MENYALQEIMIIPCFILVNFNQTKTALGVIHEMYEIPLISTKLFLWLVWLSESRKL